MESTLKEEITDKLDQILESIEVIQERCKDYQEVDNLLVTPWGMTILDACIMRLQVIGETIKGIDDKTCNMVLSDYPQVPWRKIIGLRNIISHEYANEAFFISLHYIIIKRRNHEKEFHSKTNYRSGLYYSLQPD